MFRHWSSSWILANRICPNWHQCVVLVATIGSKGVSDEVAKRDKEHQKNIRTLQGRSEIDGRCISCWKEEVTILHKDVLLAGTPYYDFVCLSSVYRYQRYHFLRWSCVHCWGSRGVGFRPRHNNSAVRGLGADNWWFVGCLCVW